MEGEAVAVDACDAPSPRGGCAEGGRCAAGGRVLRRGRRRGPFGSTALGSRPRGGRRAGAVPALAPGRGGPRTGARETVSVFRPRLADLAREPRVRRGAGHARGGGGDEGLALVLRRARLSLDKEATKKLLAEFGLADDLAHFAETVGDVREAIELRLERGDVAGMFQMLRERERAPLPKEVVADADALFRVDAEATSAFRAARVPGDVGRRRRARERSARRNSRDAPRRNQRVHEFTR